MKVFSKMVSKGVQFCVMDYFFDDILEVTLHPVFESLLCVTYVDFVADFTGCFACDTFVPVFTVVCTFAIQFSFYVAVARERF